MTYNIYITDGYIYADPLTSLVSMIIRTSLLYIGLPILGSCIMAAYCGCARRKRKLMCLGVASVLLHTLHTTHYTLHTHICMHTTDTTVHFGPLLLLITIPTWTALLSCLILHAYLHTHPLHKHTFSHTLHTDAPCNN